MKKWWAYQDLNFLILITALYQRAHEKMVGVPRLELGTSSLSGMRSNQLSYTPIFPSRKIGGAKGTRTLDLLRAKQAL